MTLKERFDTFTVPEYYSRVDTDHILELYIGLDEKGRKSIELRSAFNPRKVKGTSAIEVNQYDNQKYKTIRFSLTDEEISGLFYTFCDDLIEQTRDLTDEKGGYNTIVVRFHQWKKMFVSSKKDFLNEVQIMGLIGENGAGKSTLMNILTGCGVCLLIVSIGIYMIRRGNREIKKLQEINYG